MTSDWNSIWKSISKLRDLTTLGIANIGSTAILGIFWFYIASLLGTEGYGEVSYFLAIAGVAYIIAMFGTGNTIIVYTAKEKKIQSSLYFLALISSLITSLIVFIIFNHLGVSLFVIGSVIFGIATTELFGMKLYKKYSKYLITQKVLTVIFALGFYYMIGIDGIILGYALSFFPYVKIIYLGLKSSKPNLEDIKLKFNFMMNSNALEISKKLSFSLDKLIIFSLFGASVLGNYQLGFQFLIILGIIPFTIYDYTLPHDATGKRNEKIKAGAIIMSVALAIMGISLSPYIVEYFFPDFYNSIELIRIMSLAIVPMTISLMYTSKFLGNEKSSVVFIGSGIFLSVQISGIFILQEFFGIEGIAIAFVVAHSCQASYLWIKNKLMKI